MTSASQILSETIDVPGYGEALDPARIPPYTEDLGGGVTHEVDAGSNQFWYLNGVLHRDGDLPAVEVLGLFKAWYKNGVLFRAGDKPDTVTGDGGMEWHNHVGDLHRETGPALVFPNGTVQYYLNGREVGPVKAVAGMTGAQVWKREMDRMRADP